MDIRRKLATVPCLDCGRMITLGEKLKEGHRFTCPSCGAFLEVINLNPPELDWAFSQSDSDWDADEEDWEDEDWDDEDWDQEEEWNGRGKGNGDY
jgi:hypothetical protein